MYFENAGSLRRYLFYSSLFIANQLTLRTLRYSFELSIICLHCILFTVLQSGQVGQHVFAPVQPACKLKLIA